MKILAHNLIFSFYHFTGGKCFQGTASTSNTAPAQTTTQRQGDAATSLRFTMTSTPFISLLSAFFFGCALMFA